MRTLHVAFLIAMVMAPAAQSTALQRDLLPESSHSMWVDDVMGKRAEKLSRVERNLNMIFNPRIPHFNDREIDAGVYAIWQERSVIGRRGNATLRNQTWRLGPTLLDF